jgi:hypothetical protein
MNRLEARGANREDVDTTTGVLQRFNIRGTKCIQVRIESDRNDPAKIRI